MSEPTDAPVAPEKPERVTVDIAIENAARLLRNAEIEMDLARMERVEKLADSWIAVAGVLARREQDA